MAQVKARPGRPDPITDFTELAGKAWVLILGWLILFVPTYVRLNDGPWQTEQEGHGPFILAIFLFLFWTKREALRNAGEPALWEKTLGWIGLGFTMIVYAISRSQELLMLEAACQIPVLAGLILVTCGFRTLLQMWFPLFFLIFAVPLPGYVMDGVTGPLKIWVSEVVADMLYDLGYPIARSGVILMVGQYQLLVADACSGLNSIFSLSAIGFVYLYLAKHPSIWMNAFVLAAILPVAIMANVVRVVTLTLITYHFGDEAGQGFLHDFSGIVLFVAALFGVFFVDSIAIGVQAMINRFRKATA